MLAFPLAIATALAVAAAPAMIWTGPSPSMLATFSGEKNDYNLSVSDDGRTAVFARSEADFARARIMVATRAGDGWSSPKPIGFSDDRWRDSDPWLTPDGKTLYFVSDRPTATRPDKRDLDVWRSNLKEGVWQAPEHLGDIVNGPGEELGPEMHGDTLFFATARKSGMGGLDIYSSTVVSGGFTKPKLLSAPINSPASESDFTMSRDGNTALFWRGVNGRGLIHTSRRAPDGRWSEPEALPDHINVGSFNYTPALSPDGKRLFFASDRARDGQAAGMSDLFEIELPGG